ncbi:MAG TPA: thrombospondin type 3 repeat-containing protein [Candidatus Paceibacterota bacterium]|nr:thrombospondin type 3 repeat-containing protein [Candidatus Paceibacterota bacterium]
MSGKFKLALVVLAFAALVSVSSLLSSLSPSDGRLPATISEEKFRTFSLLDDEDGDGLSNRDENIWRTNWQNPDTDGDGYSDGEEVLSGHDPTKRGPDDLLNSDRSLTERMSSLLLGGYIKGDLKPESSQYDTALAAIVDEIFNEHERRNTFIVEQLEIVEVSTESMATYAESTADALSELFYPSGIAVYELMQANQRDSLSTEQIRGAADSVDRHAATYAAIPVPKSLGEHHRRGLTLLRMIEQELRTWEQSESHDPLSATLSATRLGILVTDGFELFLRSYVQALEAEYGTPSGT